MIPLKQVQMEIKKRKREFTVFISLMVSLCLFLLFSYLTVPHYLSIEDSGITVETTDKNNSYINFSEKVTSCKIASYTNMDGNNEFFVEAWSSVWDKILGKTTPSLSIKDFQKNDDVILYFSNQMEEDFNVKWVYGNVIYSYGGMILFPIPFMQWSLYIALSLLVIFGILWFLLKKWPRSKILSKYIFLFLIAYITAYLLLVKSFSFYAKFRDYVTIFITAILVFGIYIFGIKLLVQYKRDKVND
jgi:hypothetical protein